MKSWRKCNSRCGLIEERRGFFLKKKKKKLKNREKKNFKKRKKKDVENKGIMWHNDKVAKFIVYINIYVYTF